MWRRVSSYKSTFTSENIWARNINHVLTQAHMPVFLALLKIATRSRSQCIAGILSFECFSRSAQWLCGLCQRAVSNCLRIYMIARLTRAAMLDATAYCFHQDLWICAVAMLGHCSVSEFERCLSPTVQGYRVKGAELLPWKSRCCALKPCWNFGTWVRASNASWDEKVLFKSSIDSSC